MKNYIKKISGIVLVILLGQAVANAQPAGNPKTIEVTSAFKPSLMKHSKPVFAPSAFVGDTTRTVSGYNIPAQNLAFSFAPASLRPLAYQADSLLAGGDRVYIKGGLGNLRGATLQAVAAFGDGEKNNGQVNGYYDGVKGKLPFQQFAKYGIGARNNRSIGNNRLDLNAGFDRHDTYRYGFQPDTLLFSKNDLRLNYNHLHAGGEFNNLSANANGLWYRGALHLHYFGDNNSNRETVADFNASVNKTFSPKVLGSVGMEGMVGGINAGGNKYSNNLVMIPVSAGVGFSESIRFRAGIIPSWNNGEFVLLPDLNADILIKEGQYVLQLGFVGSYTRNTYQRLADFSPWMGAPTSLTNTRQTEVYGALKGIVDDHISFRIKAGAGKMHDLPLFINDDEDGKSFNVVFDNLTNVNVEGELIFQRDEKFYWSNSLQVNSYTNLDNFDKAYGWLPLQFRSSLRMQLIDKLHLNADVFAFSGTWYQNKTNDTNKNSGGFDLNAGLSYQLTKKWGAWFDFRNVLNNTYQRWQQYPVVGFQVLGGVSFRM